MRPPESPLAAHLADWRGDSLREPRVEARDRARLAMRAAVASASAAPHGRRPGPLPVAPGRRLVGGAMLGLAALTAVAWMGWNAPAGSALYGIRAVRQSVQLAVPGADQAGLHLQFAEQSLTDARNHLDPAASLADARSELVAARVALPSDHASALWTRYAEDETQLTTEDSRLSGQTAGGEDAGAQPSSNPAGAGAIGGQSPSPSATPSTESGGSSQAGSTDGSDPTPAPSSGQDGAVSTSDGTSSDN